jgi:hypothetical protein
VWLPQIYTNKAMSDNEAKPFSRSSAWHNATVTDCMHVATTSAPACLCLHSAHAPAAALSAEATATNCPPVYPPNVCGKTGAVGGVLCQHSCCRLLALLQVLPSPPLQHAHQERQQRVTPLLLLVLLLLLLPLSGEPPTVHAAAGRSPCGGSGSGDLLGSAVLHRMCMPPE